MVMDRLNLAAGLSSSASQNASRCRKSFHVDQTPAAASGLFRRNFALRTTQQLSAPPPTAADGHAILAVQGAHSAQQRTSGLLHYHKLIRHLMLSNPIVVQGPAAAQKGSKPFAADKSLRIATRNASVAATNSFEKK